MVTSAMNPRHDYPFLHGDKYFHNSGLHAQSMLYVQLSLIRAKRGHSTPDRSCSEPLALTQIWRVEMMSPTGLFAEDNQVLQDLFGASKEQIEGGFDLSSIEEIFTWLEEDFLGALCMCWNPAARYSILAGSPLARPDALL